MSYENYFLKNGKKKKDNAKNPIQNPKEIKMINRLKIEILLKQFIIFNLDIPK